MFNHPPKLSPKIQVLLEWRENQLLVLLKSEAKRVPQEYKVLVLDIKKIQTEITLLRIEINMSCPTPNCSI